MLNRQIQVLDLIKTCERQSNIQSIIQLIVCFLSDNSVFFCFILLWPCFTHFLSWKGMGNFYTAMELRPEDVTVELEYMEYRLLSDNRTMEKKQ